MNIATPGHNMPPDTIDTALAPFGDIITESEGWLDGTLVENECQMNAVDVLIKGVKAAKKAVETAEESAAKPIYDQWKAEKAKFAPTTTDLDRIVKGLVAIVDGFKRKLAVEKDSARKEAERLAWEATRAAQEAARSATVGDIGAQRASAQAEEHAKDAHRASMQANSETVKGMRNYDMYELLDLRGALHWIAANDKPAMTAFIEGYVAKHAKSFPPEIVRNYTEKRAV